MTLQSIIKRLLRERALVIVAALFSSRVSSNLGPRFLPLSSVEQDKEQILIEKPGTSASRSQSNRSSSFRVPMAQAHKRADRDLQARPLAVPPGKYFVLSNNIRGFAQLSDPDPIFTFAYALQPQGRAPPRLV